MKKASIFAFMLLGLQVAALAANSDGPVAIQNRATTMTRSMSGKVQLDEGQYLKVKLLNIQMLTESEDLKIRFAADPAILDQHLAEAQMRYEMDLASLLRPKQVAMYQQSRMSMTALGSPSR
ncbi:hypothetical protein SAMN02745146_3275 [Hymenobacter daecheongensis DSM 21074]|uniref:DUF4140 domain-containing protein n=1 Tax=Hymenobacter daecheongensis DSM 21074 TaxID=1121955 RepID=A0A1M6JUU2_9BACT|nr:hypothetical protein [Hymenobacter daecheongensis]SHJ50451.1 hypothetical protein SAMN02745146_3275 [Hymenobacter daecheongensis DSM 21074]